MIMREVVVRTANSGMYANAVAAAVAFAKHMNETYVEVDLEIWTHLGGATRDRITFVMSCDSLAAWETVNGNFDTDDKGVELWKQVGETMDGRGEMHLYRVQT